MSGVNGAQGRAAVQLRSGRRCTLATDAGVIRGLTSEARVYIRTRSMGDDSAMLVTHNMSPEEARDLAARLVRAA